MQSRNAATKNARRARGTNMVNSKQGGRALTKVLYWISSKSNLSLIVLQQRFRSMTSTVLSGSIIGER